MADSSHCPTKDQGPSACGNIFGSS